MQDRCRNHNMPISTNNLQQLKAKVDDFPGVQLVAHHLKVRAGQPKDFFLFFGHFEDHKISVRSKTVLPLCYVRLADR
ncbi:hypothetical protein DESC_660013 [Desulfosarcina cetonica]|nr:hypothetical protein DESC_660013 [Desulfosarcina cetonica]